MSIITTKDLELITVSEKRVTIACDEFHAHTARCLRPLKGGDERDVLILKLRDELREVRDVLDEFERKTSKLARL